jgi:hypothetical protein
MTTFTIEDILELDPCEEYTEERLKELWKGKESLALREILELTIPIDDKNWVGPRLVSIGIVIKWAHLCAYEAKKHATNAADAADAWYAARYARYAARSAADAARSTARYASEYARSAARSAADAAAADRADTRDAELYRLLTILCDMEEESK